MRASYPGYGWETNKGYPTPEHQRALDELGLTPLHRRSFRPGVTEAQLVAGLDESVRESFAPHHFRLSLEQRAAPD